MLAQSDIIIYITGRHTCVSTTLSTETDCCGGENNIVIIRLSFETKTNMNNKSHNSGVKDGKFDLWTG